MTVPNLKLVIYTFVSLLFAGCNKLDVHKNEINKIEIATGGCIRGCAVVGLIIDSTLSYRYYGGDKAELQGYYEGKITQAFWDSLNIKLKQINFTKIKSEQLGLDGENAEVIFYWGNNKKHLFKSVYNNPDSISNTFIWIINSYKHIQLHKSNEKVKFGTTYQFMKPPMPPRPKMDTITFPPTERN